MNINFLLALLKGSNVYKTVTKILSVAAGFLANNDSDKVGTDDLLAGCLLAIADGIDAYGELDNNQEGNIVDGLIAGLTRYREEMISLGRITVATRQNT